MPIKISTTNITTAPTPINTYICVLSICLFLKYQSVMMRTGGAFFLEMKSYLRNYTLRFFFGNHRRKFWLSAGRLGVPLNHQERPAIFENSVCFLEYCSLVFCLKQNISDEHFINGLIFDTAPARGFKVCADKLNVGKLENLCFGFCYIERF